jgi:hypothetical protein
LEDPAPRALGLSPISKLGLLYFTPDACRQVSATRQILEGEMTFMEVERNDSAFFNFLAKVVTLLDGPLPAPEPDVCDWCKYRARTGSHTRRSDSLVTDDASVPTCPKCRGPMQLKKGRFGDFWSCMNYPDCRGSRNVKAPQPS